MDEKFDYVLCKDILEHVNYIPLINEIYRILKKKGILSIRTPHFTSKLNYEDPTHKHQFSINTFNFFLKNSNYAYTRNVNFFSDIKKMIIFEKGSRFLKIFNSFFEKWINSSYLHQNLYESSFLRMFPAMNIHIILIK